jgi:L-fuculose-phosphate aldolase
MKSEWQLKQEVVRICRMLHQKNLIAATDGNISVRLPGQKLLTTPSGVNKGFITEEQLIVVDLSGQVVEGQGRPTSELEMHLLAHRLRPEIRAVLHAHPPLATAFSIAGVSLEESILPEVVMSLRKIPTTAYATPTTPEVPEVIRELIRSHDALILARHGALTVGRNLGDAYNKMEKLEHTALVVLAARQLGEVRCLPQEEVHKLVCLAGEQGLGAQKVQVQVCEHCGQALALGPGEDERLRQLVREEMARFLQDK